MSAQPKQNEPLSEGKYPPDLIEEYKTLALKQLLNPLSSEEGVRWHALKEQIAKIDRADPATEAMRAHFDKLNAALEQIRAEAQELINAKKQGK